jgi:pimeloyl-ACP methyl ester carboxylesterase
MSDLPQLPGVRHEHLDVGGLRMHVALAGPEDGPAIVLVHGWPQNWWVWREVIPALAGSFRVIVPDLRGHGWSAAPPGGYEKEQLATDILGLLDRLEVERASWIGHDWGGWVGFLAAIRAPERFGRMLALGIPHPWIAPHPRQLAMLGYQGPISLPFLGLRLARPMARAILQSGRGGVRLAAGDLAIFSDNLPPAVTVAMYRTFLTREALPMARGRFADVTLDVATTLALGARDLVTRGIPAGPVDGQPKLEVQRWSGVGHWLPEQRSGEIVRWAESIGRDRVTSN